MNYMILYLHIQDKHFHELIKMQIEIFFMSSEETKSYGTKGMIDKILTSK